MCLPTTLNFAVPGLSSRLLQDLFDAADVRVSQAARRAAPPRPSPAIVLQAMGLPDWQAAGAVRLSIGPAADDDFIAEACARIRACGESLRRNCLSPADNAPTVGEGITRFMLDGACCYLLADSLSQRCVLIDARPEQVSRLVQALQCQGYPLLAALSTTFDPEHEEARALLAAELGELMPAEEVDAFGWPLAADEITLGQRRLVRRMLADGQVLLFGAAISVEPEFAFGPAPIAMLAPQTLLAPMRDEAQLFATRPGLGEDTPFAQLDGAQLPAFVAAHPDALLVDVREPYEQFLSQTPELHGVALTAMPLSRLLNAVQPWLDAQRPLLFFCRSGNRSRQAAQALARLGHTQAWTLAGGLALLPATSPEPDPADVCLNPSISTAPSTASSPCPTPWPWPSVCASWSPVWAATSSSLPRASAAPSGASRRCWPPSSRPCRPSRCSAVRSKAWSSSTAPAAASPSA